jgi:hypothetical protein
MKKLSEIGKIFSWASAQVVKALTAKTSSRENHLTNVFLFRLERKSPLNGTLETISSLLFPARLQLSMQF